MKNTNEQIEEKLKQLNNSFAELSLAEALNNLEGEAKNISFSSSLGPRRSGDY